jgi:hypothetical protein
MTVSTSSMYGSMERNKELELETQIKENTSDKLYKFIAF